MKPVIIIAIAFVLLIPPTTQGSTSTSNEIPAWIKNNAGWWAEGAIDDNAFTQGIQYLIKEKIMNVESTSQSSAEPKKIPSWVKNNAGWWADDIIDDSSFLQGIQFLIKEGIIVIEQEQTQPTVSNKEIQKLADEYWNCFVGDAHLSSNCIAWDEDKHIVGGIDEMVYISGYMVFDGTGDDSNWLMDYHDPVDAKLEKFQDEDLHKQLFDMYVSITPKQLLGEVAYFEIITDDYGGKESAAIGRGNWDGNLLGKFWLSVDPVDMAPSAGSIDEQYHKASMIHENAHILSLGSSQSDNDVIYPENDEELRQIITEKEYTCAPNYFTDIAGCMKDYSYLNLFFQKFWTGIYSDFKWFYEFDDYDKFLDHNALIYQKHKNQFVTEHAASNPDEDFAESFTEFVLKEKPTKSTIADQKIRFFYDFPELIEMRDFIRSNL